METIFDSEPEETGNKEIPDSIYKCVIAVAPSGKSVLIDSTPDIYKYDVFDGYDLHENIDNVKDIPEKVGVFECEIECFYYQSNHPSDPIDYDINIVARNFKLIE